MRKLRMPSISMTDVLDRCLDHINDDALIKRANDSRAFLQQAENDYSDKGRANELYKIRESDAADHLTKSDARFLYDKLSSKTPETRELYDKIKTLARGMLCPLCNQRTVSTLDHYLSKSFHAALTITPTNLVPSCRDCNLGSGVRRPASPGDQTIHPYFDLVDDEIWLEATIIESDPPAVLFYVTHPSDWDITKFQSVCSHFKSFGLGDLYGIQAGQELVNIYVDLVNSSKIDTASDLRAHFLETAKRRRFPVKNSWQAALYSAAAASDWFCDGGYLQIANSELFGD